MKFLDGIISRRIRNGSLPKDVRVTSKVPPADDSPRASSVRNGQGRALGNPARSNRSAGTSDR
jgi:hypothetical protein